MEPKFAEKPAFTVVGVLYRGRNEHNEIPQLWDGALIPRIAEIRDQVTPPLAYGVMDHFDPQTGEFDYLAGFGVANAAQLPAGMVRWDVPGGQYAVFPCTLATVKDVFGVARRWFEETGTLRGDGPEFELYDEHFMGGDSNFYIYIPVKRSA